MSDNETQLARAREQRRRKHQAYLEVFGAPEKPTAAGAIVLADLERFARFNYSAVYRPRVGKNPGPLDPYATIYNVALKDFVQRIHQWLAWSDDNDDSDSSFDGE